MTFTCTAVAGRTHFWTLGVIATAAVYFAAPAKPADGAPLIGAIVHTEYTSDNSLAWEEFRNSISFLESSKHPTVGFYVQDSPQFDIARQVRQFYVASLDYVLLSWYGGGRGAVGATKTFVLRRYIAEITRQNRTAKHKVKFAVLVEFGARQYAKRLDFLQAEIYRQFKDDALIYDGNPVIALGFDPSETSDEVRLALGYARSLHFFAFDGRDSKGGGGAFGGVMWRNAPANRVTPLAAVISPGLDVSGRGLHGRSEPFQPKNPDGIALCHNASVPDLPCAWISERDFHIATIPQFKIGQLYVKFDEPIAQRVCIAAINCENKVYASCISRGDFGQLDFHEAMGNCQVRAYVASNRALSDEIRGWLPPTALHRPSLEVYDKQWEAIDSLPKYLRPAFISIASFNSWTEGTMIEDNSVDGPAFLLETAKWAERLRND